MLGAKNEERGKFTVIEERFLGSSANQAEKVNKSQWRFSKDTRSTDVDVVRKPKDGGRG